MRRLLRRRYVVTVEYRSEDPPGARAGGIAWSVWERRFWWRWRARDEAYRHFLAGGLPLIVDVRTGRSVRLF